MRAAALLVRAFERMASAVRAALVAMAVLAVVSGCRPPAPKTSIQTARVLSEEETQRLVRYYARRANVPAGKEMHVSELHETPATGLWSGVLDTATGRLPFTMSANGRYVLFAPIEDLTADPYAELMQRISLAGVPVRGPENARVTIVEYGDFQCPYTARAFDTIESQVLARYKGQVRFAYKHRPLTLHPWAEPAAVAAECVRVQNVEAYWSVYSGLFQSQGAISNSNLQEAVVGFVGETGVDPAVFADCFEKRQTLPVVRAQAQEAIALGVQTTPTFFINGRRIVGAAPFETFSAVIDTELAWR